MGGSGPATRGSTAARCPRSSAPGRPARPWTSSTARAASSVAASSTPPPPSAAPSPPPPPPWPAPPPPRRDEPVDGAFFRRRVEASLALRREGGLASDAFRVVWSEADGLPGLVVDRYATVAVIRCLTLGMTRCRPWIVEALRRLAGITPYYGHDEGGGGRTGGG